MNPRLVRPLRLGLLLSVLLCGGVHVAHAEDEPGSAVAEKPPRCLQFARVIDRMVTRGDLERLASLERGIDPDPWLLSWILIQQGKADVARAFHKACSCTEIDKLPAMLDTWAASDADTDLLAKVVAMEHAAHSKGSAETLAAAAPLLEKTPPFVGALATLRAAAARRRLGEHEKATSLLTKAEAACRALGWVWGEDAAQSERGKLYFAQMEPRKALAAFEAVVARRRGLGWRTQLGTGLLDLAAVHGLLQNYHGVLAYNATAAPLLHPAFQRQERFTARMNAGVARALLGRLAAAVTDFEAARTVAEELESPAMQSDAWIHIAWMHARLGRFDVAERARTQAEALADKVPSPEGRAYVDAFTGGLRALRAERTGSTEDWDAAFAAHERARLAFTAQEAWAMAARAQLAQATVRGWQGRHGEARPLLTAARTELEKLGEDTVVAEANLLDGWLHLAADDPFAAEEAFDVALEGARAVALLHQEAVALHGRAAARAASIAPIAKDEDPNGREARRRRADGRRVLADVMEAVRIQGRLASGLSEEQLASAREGFAITPLGQDRSAREDLFELGLAMARLVDDPARAFALIESSRALGFVELHGGLGELRRTGVSDTDREEEELARREEALARFAYDRARRRGRVKQLADATKALRAAQAKVADVLERSQRRAKARTHAVHPRAARLVEVQGALAPGDVLASFAVFEDQVHAVLLRKDGAPTLQTLGPLAPIREALAALHADVEEHGEPSAKAFGALGTLLIEPLGENAKATRLMVSPDGALHGVPFSALLPGCEVTQIPSASAWLTIRYQERPSGTGILGVGAPTYARGRGLEPLDGADAELDALPGEGVTRLKGDKATVAGLVAALPAKDARLRALHVACHGQADEERPTASSLELASDTGHTGSWRAQDIMLTHVPADLVVLSACRTGVGRSYRGEGLLGLPRAFLIAGADRVMASLWKVDDEATRALMGHFYAAWQQGTSPAAALCQAQAAVKADPRWAHPYYWAAWVVWGREG